MTALRARSTAKNPSESLSVEIVTVTPAMAKKWLTTNEHNRNIKKSKVTVYARQMAAGEWQLTGQTIEFDTTGRLIDGQHRLLAIIESGESIRLLVAKGVRPEAQSVLDTGAARTYGDVLSMQGVENATHVAAIAKRLCKYESGFYNDGGNLVPANFEMADVITKHPGIHASASQAARLARGVLTPSVVGMWHCLLTERDPYSAETFFTSLRDGIGLELGSPVLALRNRLDRDRQYGLRVNEAEQGALIVYAWNAFREGRSLTKMNLPKGGVHSGNFPVAV